jgi:RimJ/RimL family protein N-acetyltransferase
MDVARSSRMTESISEIRTPRLLLRAVTHDDLDAALRIHCDPETNRYNPAPFSTQKVHELIETWCNDWRDRGIGYWTVRTLDEEHHVIGFTGIRHKQMHDQPGLNLYFRYGPEAWGKGYAVEGGRVTLDVAFGALRAPSVRAVARRTNLPSIKTIERLGLHFLYEFEEGPEGKALLYEIRAAAFDAALSKR